MNTPEKIEPIALNRYCHCGGRLLGDLTSSHGCRAWCSLCGALYRVTEEDRSAIQAAFDPTHVRCECGGWMKEACNWRGPVAETVLIEWHPGPGLRVAADYGRPQPDGSTHLRCVRFCAERILEQSRTDPAGSRARIVA